MKARRWSKTLAPLADAFVIRFSAFLPKATYPIRVGTHFNSAFALTLALEYSEVAADDALKHLLVNKALAWYAERSELSGVGAGRRRFSFVGAHGSGVHAQSARGEPVSDVDGSSFFRESRSESQRRCSSLQP